MVRMTLDSPQELIPALEKHAGKSGTSIPGFIQEKLEFRCLHRLPEHRRGDIHDRPEVRRAIRIKDDMRRRHERLGYSGSAAVHEIWDRGWQTVLEWRGIDDGGHFH